jgi:hypothetical protein
LALELASGRNVRAAAQAAGVSLRTATRRMADAKFRSRINAIRAKLTAQASGRLAASMATAADVLTALLAHDDPKIRLRAAERTIELAVQVTELNELQRQVQDLETLVATEAAARSGTG